MAERKSITGLWRGIYQHAAQAELSALPPVTFVMTVQQGWFGFFSGTVEDDATGMPGLGTITGRFAYPSLRFVKRMPVSYVRIPDGRKITLRGYLQEHGLTYQQEIPHRPIFYTGQFVDELRAAGDWIIPAGPIALPDRRQIQGVETRGTWTLEKAA